MMELLIDSAKRGLNFERAAYGFYGAAEFRKDRVSSRVENTPAI